MPWYYYSGQKPVALPIGDGSGEVVSVRPHSKIELHPSSANDVQIRTLSKMGVLKRTGKPESAMPIKKVEEVPIEAPKSGPGEPFKFNEFLVKEGTKRVGRPDPEESVAPVDRAVPEGEKVADADDGDVQEDEGSSSRSKKRRSRRTRSS